MRTRRSYPYWDWEDYHAGLYGLTWRGESADAESLLRLASDLERFMRQAIEQWPKAAEHHLSNDETNRRAWLGWAACGVARQVPAHFTRAAWWRLTEAERTAANSAADRVIRDWDAGYAQTLF